MNEPDFEPKPIAWLILLDQDGKLFGIQDNRILPPQGKSRSWKSGPIPISRTMTMPREKGRTCNTYAFLLFDKAEYVFGIDPDKNRSGTSLKERFNAFHHKVLSCYKATQDDGVEAVLKFLERVKVGYRVDLPEDCKSNDLFAFIYLPDSDEKLVTDRPAVIEYWISLRKRKKDQKSKRGGETQEPYHRCLITGQRCVPVDKHPRIMGLPGATSGAPLVSFNKKSFNSYGWKDNVNATISREAAEACGTALNRLLSRSWPKPGCPGEFLPKWSLSISSDIAVCYWSDTDGSDADEFLSQLGDIVEGNEEKVSEPYQALWRGEVPTIETSGNIGNIHVLTLSSVQGRVAVRDYFQAPTDVMLRNVAQHFADINIVRNTPKPARGLPPVMGLSLLLESFSFLREQSQQNDKKNPTPLEITIIRAILHGAPYPRAMLSRALLRLRAEFCRHEWINLQRRDACVAWIKAVMNRSLRLQERDLQFDNRDLQSNNRDLQFTKNSLTQEVTKDMNWDQEDRSYWYGCLLAVIEKAQALAVGNISATVIEKHFGAASATPLRTFGQLLRKMRQDMTRAKHGKQAGGVARLEKIADEVISRVDAFELTLDLEHQCVFVLGYHHMRHWLWENLYADQENWEFLWQEVTAHRLATAFTPAFTPTFATPMEATASVAAN